jgi:ATP-dependent DNA helicase RecG
MSIPLTIEKLLAGKVVESERLEFKRSWNPSAILRTITAFANDYENLGSGYIVVGIEEENGMPKRPVFGFEPESFDRVQKEMLGYCNLIRPTYFPRLSLEEIDGKHVLLIWVNAGSNRPYEVPRDVTANTKDYHYYIRRFSSTVQANVEEKKELISLTANIPFDDRVNHKANLFDISIGLVQQHLRAIGSKLQDEINNLSHLALCRQMNLVEGSDEHILPKNVALMMFNAKPSTFFPATAINIVEFPDGVAGSIFIEKNFDGPIQQQLMDALAYLKAQIIKSKTIKIKGEALSKTFFNYPFEAIEEALANAVYHKNYELREPIEVRILPEAIEIISYGGPDPSIRKDDLNNGIIRARRYRNRRIGEYLKELNLTEGKGTGIPTIKRALSLNGSKPAVYDTDGDERRFFVVILPVHEVFLLEDSNQDKLKIDQDKSKSNIDKSKSDQDKPKSDQDKSKSNIDKPKINQDKPKINQDKTEINQDKSKINQDKILENLEKDLLRNYRKEFKKQILKRMIDTLIYCDIARTKMEILEHIGLTRQTRNFKEYIEPIVEMGFLKRTLPEIPTSRNQKYITTIEGHKLITNK